MTYSRIMRPGPRIGLLCLLAVCSAFASADLKLVSKVTAIGRRGPQVVTVVSYFKGSMVRIDNASVTKISDSRTHKTILINNKRKVYAIANQQEAIKNVAASLKKENIKITAHIKPTGKTRMIAGKSAHQYVGDLTVTGTFPQQQGSTAKVTFSINEWTTSVKGVSVSQTEMMGTIADLLRSLNSVKGMQKVTAELSKIKGIPLTTHLDGNFTIFAAGGGAPQSRKITYDTEAQFATEESLPMSLFQVPAGYKQEGMTGKPAPGKPAKKK
jgi:hypothetical protein